MKNVRSWTRRLLAPVLALTVMGLLPGRLAGQTDSGDKTSSPALQNRVQTLEEQVRQLQAEVLALKAALTAAAPAAGTAASAATPVPAAAPPAAPEVLPPPGAQAPAGGPLPVYGGSAAASKALNPDISVIGDFIASAGHNPVSPISALEMHETELGFQSIIDPYARGDFFITFGPEEIGLEEGYITFTSLPYGLVAKAGKMRAVFGKVNTLHNHTLPWIDRPMVTDNLVGGEDGINDAGLSGTRIFAGPANTFLEATAQVFRGESAGLFHASRHNDLAVVGHFRGYRDIGDSSNVDLGFSYARGHNEFGSQFLTNLYGIDATFRWRPLRRAIYQSFLARSEFIWNRRDAVSGLQKAFGFYTAAEYRVNRRWTVGGRYDSSDRFQDGVVHDRGASAVLTYWPSEFSQVRGQYRFARYGGDGRLDANELRLQLLFSLGAHGAHPF